jgi:hypothetical protein
LTQLTYTVPTPGVNFSLTAPQVDTALTQILTVVNGGLDSSNLNLTAVAAALQPLVPGALLGKQWYSPGSLQNYAVAANTWAWPDSTNLAVTATVPASGNVLFKAHGGILQSNGATSALAGVGTTASGGPTISQLIGTTDVTTSTPYHMEALMTGLTPNASTTFYLSLFFNGTNGNFYVDGGSTLAGGPLLLTVTGA